MITVTNLRKIFTEQGTKGASKWKREDFESTIIAAEFAAYAEAETRKPVVLDASPTATKRGYCTDCGRKEDFRASGLCTECREYAEWENTHSDEGHANQEFPVRDALTESCQVCHPELDGRKAVKPTGRSRAGMVIVAKGSEVHKSEVFRLAAEAAGWTVSITSGGEDHFYADAHKDGDAVQLAWEGRAYNYPASSARINGKDRKVRNLKEALRLLVG